MTAPAVYVLVINWNGRDHLEACFDSLLASTYPDARYVLVDNGSTDDSIALMEARYEKESQIEILALDQNYGWSGGNNRGIQHAQEAGAAYIFLLNNDTAIAPEAIAILVETMAQCPECAALAPKMLFYDRPEIINSVGLEMSVAGAAWDKGIGQPDSDRWTVEEALIGVCGGACFLRASALQKTTLLPEEFGIYLDDLDLCLQLWDAGYTVWSCPKAVVRHKFSPGAVSEAAQRRKYFLNTRNRFWMLQRNIPWRYILRVVLAVIEGETRAFGRAVMQGAYWKITAHLRAWGSTVGNASAAIKERKARRDLGQQSGKWWRLVKSRPLFCPDYEKQQKQIKDDKKK